MDYKVLAVTTGGDDREDGNVYYSEFYLVHDPRGNLPETVVTKGNYPDQKAIEDWAHSLGCSVSQKLDTIYYTVEK